MMQRAIFILTIFILFTGYERVCAHEVRPGYLELREGSPGRYEMLWKRPARGEVMLQLDPVFPEACKITGPGSLETAPGAMLTRATMVCRDGLQGLSITIAGLEATMTDVLIRVYHADGAMETHMLRPVSPTAMIGAAGSSGQRAVAYLRLGVEHILMGVDHLLFVLGLLLIVSSRLMLVKTITSFTVAHSITLAIATFGYASAPMVPLNAAIALSILFLGPEIIRSQRGETSLTIRHPWVVAFAFGLLHGFGFATGLTTMGLPRAEIPLALLLFNLGVEAGQLFFVLIILLLARSFRILKISWPRWVEAVPAYTVGGLGAYWTIQRSLILLGGLTL
jgi:hydrogenase/urease accessory protein HupE